MAAAAASEQHELKLQRLRVAFPETSTEVLQHQLQLNGGDAGHL